MWCSSPSAGAPFTEGLGLAEAGIDRRRAGQDQGRSPALSRRSPGIYAIGDVDRRPDAGAQGRRRGGRRGGDPRRAGRSCELRCHSKRGLYTSPEIASVGRQRGGTQRRQGVEYQGRQVSLSRPMPGLVPWVNKDGFVKILTDAAPPIACSAPISWVRLPAS